MQQISAQMVFWLQLKKKKKVANIKWEVEKISNLIQ